MYTPPEEHCKICPMCKQWWIAVGQSSARQQEKSARPYLLLGALVLGILCGILGKYLAERWEKPPQPQPCVNSQPMKEMPHKGKN